MGLLTPQEAADMLRLPDPADYPQLNILLPFVEDFIKTATGHDWASDLTIDPTAKMLAATLAVRWFDDPAQMGNIPGNDIGVKSLIGQLHAKALGMLVV
ncbi:hypothetical protein DEAC_c14200 [Desulfosporosinus acididurans]|uniref:Phage gp6-like head-tail connector protein n=1 Tax=Desulfosporosinus acididurans TaxID=476652 RepID=A0A0J1FTX8_9FIRM|nr:hypothetical protein [Desulfosporosinus acididurans]KLU66752.1 hypothetical protein DEAC_c14200 [Desulfosporosinus acididurans]